MMIYIDLGCHNGDTIKQAMQFLPEIDLFVGFEPVHKFFNKSKRKFEKNNNVKLYNMAVGWEDKDFIMLYLQQYKSQRKIKIGQGSTILKGMYMKERLVNHVCFSKYIKKNFKKSDFIILKIDIEGAEYGLLEHLIKTKTIEYINKIFCEWHQKKLLKIEKKKENYEKQKEKKLCFNRYVNLIQNLNKLGFNLTGSNFYDSFFEKNFKKFVNKIGKKVKERKINLYN